MNNYSFGNVFLKAPFHVLLWLKTTHVYSSLGAVFNHEVFNYDNVMLSTWVRYNELEILDDTWSFGLYKIQKVSLVYLFNA